MWLQTKYGFYSIVCGTRTSNKQPGRWPDPTTRLIRARQRDHLEHLQDQFGDIIGKLTIQDTYDCDYGWRLVCGVKRCNRLVAALMVDLDYSNFKDEAHASRPGDSAYSAFLHKTWHNGLDMQPPGTSLYNPPYNLEPHPFDGEVPQVPRAWQERVIGGKA